jgi:transposase-like protein
VVVGERTGADSAGLLEAGRDYPRTYQEFRKMFGDEQGCRRFLQELRWPHGFVCPACSHAGAPYEQSRGRLVCSSCRHQTTATAGTILDKTRTELMIWFEAAWHLTTAKNGMSAKTLERTLGTSYRVAWVMLQRFRVAMVGLERTQLTGRVEVDECLVGGISRGGKPGRGTTKNLVLVAVERHDPKGFGRVRLRHVPVASKRHILPFVRDVVERGTEVITDGWASYGDLSTEGFVHTKHNQATSAAPPHVAMPAAHRLASLLKRWLLGTHKGSFSAEHLQSYLEEFTFRFNRRTSRSRGLVFRRLLEQAVVTVPVTEADVTGGFDWTQHHNL